MKFAEHLQAHITPEWRKQYIQYEEMKSMLYNSMEQAPAAELVEPDIITRYYAQFDEQFFHFSEKELIKINTFFNEKLSEATRKYVNLKSELDSLKESEENERSGIMGGLRKRKEKAVQFFGGKKEPIRKLQDLKLAFSEFYLSLILLQNYQNLNYTGFRKILKKHDKLLNSESGAKWRDDKVEVSGFHTNKNIDKLIHDTENTVTLELESGNRAKAMKRLRVPPLGDQQSPWTTFKVGLFSGAFMVLVIAVALSAVFHGNRDDWKIVFRLYRGPLLLVLFIFLMGINVYGWRSSGVNHVLIFELDPRNHLSEQHLMELAAIIGVVWTLSVLSFLYSEALALPAFSNPLALVIILTIFMINPTKTFHHEARFWVLRVMGHIICAPFFHVGFADFWLADQLNSLGQVILDFEYLICFYATSNGNLDVAEDPERCHNHHYIRPLIACLPAWFRFMQCLRRYRDSKEAFPHLVNAGKYSTTFFVVLFSTLNTFYRDTNAENYNVFFYLWVVSSVISSSYAYIWDIKMDWGLFDKNAGDNTFLREEMVYASPSYYYFAIIEDLVLRFAWVVNLLLTEMGTVESDVMTSILSPLEVFRRFVWNFFRLENEHLNNCGKFRAVRDISVVPLDASDQTQIIKMMDEADGVTNRRPKKKSGKGKKAADQRILLEGDTTDDPDA